MLLAPTARVVTSLRRCGCLKEYPKKISCLYICKFKSLILIRMTAELYRNLKICIDVSNDNFEWPFWKLKFPLDGKSFVLHTRTISWILSNSTQSTGLQKIYNIIINNFNGFEYSPLHQYQDLWCWIFQPVLYFIHLRNKFSNDFKGSRPVMLNRTNKHTSYCSIFTLIYI